MFSHSIVFASSFYFSFDVQKPFNLMESHLFIFAFVAVLFGVYEKKT